MKESKVVQIVANNNQKELESGHDFSGNCLLLTDYHTKNK